MQITSTLLCVGLLLTAAYPTEVWAQDTLTVEMSLAPAWGSTIELVEELRLGSAEGRPHEAWGRLGGLIEGSNGGVYIVDGQVPAIFQFGAGGDYLGTIGRSGEGPGEFRAVHGMSLSSDNRLFVQDVSGGKVIVYRADGSLEREFRLVTFLVSSRTFQVDFEGNAYVRSTSRAPTARSRIDLRYPPHVWIKHGAEGEVLDTIPVSAADPEGPHYTLITSEGARSPFTVMNVSAMSPAGYLVWGRNDRYTIHRRISDGTVVRLVLPRSRVPVTGDEEAQWEAMSQRFEGSAFGDEYDRIPGLKPFFRSIWPDADGRIWVERYVRPFKYEYSSQELSERGDRPPYVWREPQVFDVIDPRGRFLATIALPPRSQLLAARGSHLWVLELGDYDVQYAVRYSIRRDP